MQATSDLKNKGTPRTTPRKCNTAKSTKQKNPKRRPIQHLEDANPTKRTKMKTPKAKTKPQAA